MYLKTLLERAWGDTTQFLKARLLFQALVLFAGASIGYIVGDPPTKLATTLVYAFAASILTAIAVFLWNFLRAPAQIHDEQQSRIATLEESLRPQLQIDFDEDDDTYFYESQWFYEIEDLFDNKSSFKGIKYWRLCRVAIRNISETTSIENVEVKLTAIDPLPKELKGKLPLRLHFMNDNVQPYDESKDINPGSTEFIDVVGWVLDRDVKEPTFYLYHSVSDIDANFPVDDYRIKIAAYGKNAICEPSTFYIGMRNKDGKANKLWMSTKPL